jgi:hypothetical protein
MIDPTFPTQEKLRKMTLPELRSLRVLYPEEEQMLQEAIYSKLSEDKRPPRVEIFDNDIKGANIATIEQEQEFQTEIDRRKKEALKQMNMSEKELEVELEKIKPKEVVSEPSKIKCELCGSKGFRHKKGCPTLTKIK